MCDWLTAVSECGVQQLSSSRSFLKWLATWLQDIPKPRRLRLKNFFYDMDPRVRSLLSQIPGEPSTARGASSTPRLVGESPDVS